MILKLKKINRWLFVSSIFSLFLITTQVNAEEYSNSLKPFYTDGCTLFIDGPFSKPGLWRHCCVEHDLRYWFGGDRDDAHQADLRLEACVRSVAGKVWSQIIFKGVRLGRYSPIKHKTHWGWGWNLPREKVKLDPLETNYVIAQLRQTEIDQSLVEEFIQRNFP